MKRKILSALFATILLVSCLAVTAFAAEPVAVIGSTTYESLAKAVENYNDTSTVIQLLKSTDENITISKNVYLDLNGHDVTGAVNVSAGTLYCMDSQTDDYTVKDSAGYGKLTNVSGNVEGIPADAACVEKGYQYLMINEDDSLSFHRVNLHIHAMTLRAEEVGLYYKCKFGGDELVKENVKQFGIALSVQDIPDANNLERDCKYSIFTEFNVGEQTEEKTSTLLKGVMKTSNAYMINQRNANMPVYGRAYILTEDGYVFGNFVKRSLVNQVEDIASDKYWTGYDEQQQEAAIAMYRQYNSLMRSWKVTNIESALVLNKKDPLITLEEGKDIKVLAITSSFGLNTTQLLYDVILAEAQAQGITLGEVAVGRLYASGCTLEKHVTNAPDKQVYQYTKVTNDPNDKIPGRMRTHFSEGTATLLDGLLDEEWDIIFMQQGARQAPLMDTYLDSNGQNYITRLRNIMQEYVQQQCPNARFVWNMLWAFAKDSTQDPFDTVFNSNQDAMYQANIDTVLNYVIPRTDYDRIIPSGTVIQNARTSYFSESLCRDTYHLNNTGAALAAYGLYAVLTGQELTEVNLDIVAATKVNGMWEDVPVTTPLTDEDKMVIIESVNNALRNPFKVTASEHPAVDYSSYTYAEDLTFFGDSDYAVCPACDAKVQWIKVNQDNLAERTAQGYLGNTIAEGSYHIALTSDIEFTAANKDNSFLHIPASNRKACLHLNGNDLTATNCAITILAGNSKLNVMGTGTVSGNHTHSDKYRGSAFVLNAATTTDPGTIRLYSGTYVQPANNTQWAPIGTGWQAGLLEIYNDVTVTGNTNSIYLNTTNGNASKQYTETVNIYGGTFNGAVYCKPHGTDVTPATALNISGGTFNDGIEITGNTNLTLSGTPVIKGAGLKLASGVTVNLGELTTGASIAVDAAGAFTAANPKAADYLKYFSAVRQGCNITAQSNVLYCN